MELLEDVRWVCHCEGRHRNEQIQRTGSGKTVRWLGCSWGSKEQSDSTSVSTKLSILVFCVQVIPSQLRVAGEIPKPLKSKVKVQSVPRRNVSCKNRSPHCLSRRRAESFPASTEECNEMTQVPLLGPSMVIHLQQCSFLYGFLGKVMLQEKWLSTFL